MAINTVIEGNILKIDDSIKIQYWNAAWVSMYFDDTNVYLYNNALPSTILDYKNPYKIPMADFEYDGASSTTESTIATVLSDKIG
tara:strand:+ start:1006 stop:1260 length:255 start_codon:yes stop_codon:yes gene_type:complete